MLLCPDREVWVEALPLACVLCSWARHFTLKVRLSQQVYKWVPCDRLASYREAGVETLLAASCCRNRDKLWHDELVGSYIYKLNLYLPKRLKFYKLCDSLLFSELTQFKPGPVYLVWSYQYTANLLLEDFLQSDAGI